VKGILFLLVSVFLLAVVAYKRHVGNRTLASLEDGKLCVRCNSTAVLTEGKGIRCQKCGHFTDLEWLNRAAVDPEEVARLQRLE
jgi:hypothetical protein